MAHPRLSIAQVSRLLSSGSITSESLVTYCYALAQSAEDSLHAYARFTPWDELLVLARAADDRRRLGETLSVLDGVPISIKANIAVADHPLTAGSRLLGAENVTTPAVGYQSSMAKALIDNGGAICIGSTNLDEFGMGSLGNNQQKPTRNPRPFWQTVPVTDDEAVAAIQQPATIPPLDLGDTWYSAGGSSCGSAVSVAHGSALLSVGTDTGGSVRLPAAWCGIVGWKPSYGRLSRHGLVPYASSLDTPGILTPTVECAALVWRHLMDCHVSETDSTASMIQQEMEPTPLTLSGLKIGIPAAFSVSDCRPAIRDAWSLTADRLHGLGAEVCVVEDDVISADSVKRSLAAYYVLSSAEASSNLARYDGVRYGVAVSMDEYADNDWTVLEQQYAATRTSGFGPEVARRILCGTSVLSSDRFHTYYEAAAKLRGRLTEQLDSALTDCDLMLIPTAIFPPADLRSQIDPTMMFANDIMTVPVSLAGLPAVALPIPSRDSIVAPSMQLVGRRHDETTVLRAAMALEYDL